VCVLGSLWQVTRDSGAGADRERLRRERQQQKKSQWNFWHNNRNQDRIQYTSSVDIRPEWPVLEQIQLSALTKLTGTPPKGEPEQLAQCGHLEYYDKNYDRIGAKQEVSVERRRAARDGSWLPKLTGRFSLAIPHTASSAPWSSTPSLRRSISLAVSSHRDGVSAG